MKTNSKWIKGWIRKGGNNRGDEWILKPRDKRNHKVSDIHNLQADEVNVVAVFGSQENGRRETICTVAQLEEQKQPHTWLQLKIEAAEAKMLAKGSAISTGRDHVLDVLIRKFKAEHVKNLRCAHYYEQLLKFWSEKLGQIQISGITPSHIHDIKEQLLETAPKKGSSSNKKLTNKTICNYLSVLSSCLKWGQQQGVELVKPGFNPVVLIKWPEVKGATDNKRKAVFHRGSEELKALADGLNESTSPDLRDFVYFCLTLGVRRSEARGLTWNNVDLERGYLHLRQALRRNVCDGVDEDGNFIYAKNENGGKYVITKGLKNSDDSRSIPLEKFPSIAKILIRRKAAASERQLASGIREDRVFPQDPSKAWNTLIKKLGLRHQGDDRLDDYVFHTLRHSAATWQVQDGVPLFKISKFLGHNNLQSVDRYTHWDTSQLDDSAATAEAGVADALGAV
jgi:integrase